MIETRVLPAPNAHAPSIQEAAERLRQGGLVAFPTETVYGLGADGLNPEAVARIYEAKGRPATNPLILHVGGVAEARELAAAWPESARILTEHFWPGPLTLVLSAASCVPAIVRANHPTVALRCPAHPVALALVRATGRPLAAPSANRSTGISPTSAAHVSAHLAGRIELILDGGVTQAGLESTIIALDGATPRLLRPGPIAPSELEALIGPLERWSGAIQHGEAQTAPGMAAKHYAPQTRLRLLDRNQLVQAALASQGRAAVVTFGACPELPATLEGHVLPLDAQAAGSALYALLHDLDNANFESIFCQRPPDGDAWLAIRDRLFRAASED